MNDVQLANIIASAVAAYHESPERAASSWYLRPAQIETPSAVSPTGVFAGDGVLGGPSTPVALTSLIGYVGSGARVMVLTIPPAGNYVIADLSGATAARAAVSGSVSVTDSTQWTFPDCGTSFVAPASGKVMIDWSSEMVTTGGFFLIGPQVTLGPDVGSTDDIHTGWEVSTADRFIRVGNTETKRFGMADLCEELTPGATYAVTLWHLISFGQTGTGTRRIVTVTPTH